MKQTALAILIAMLILVLIIVPASAQDEEPPDPAWNFNNQNSTVNGNLSGQTNKPGGTTSNSGNNSSSTNISTGGGNNNSNRNCRPGVASRSLVRHYFSHTTAAGVKMCRRWIYAADDCGTLLYTTSGGNIVPCPSGGDEDEEEEVVTNPCTIDASMAADGLTASCSDQWECKVKVPLPPSYIDVRPYPATLVRWPTALRFSGQGTTKDVCTVENAGSMRNLTMELEFRPATGIVTITLPYLPVFNLRAPEMVNFKWEVPSHPAAGGDVLAGTLGGFFDEIPADFPAFSGLMKTPYDLFWKITFEKNGRGYIFDGKLLPQDVRDTPALYFADLNGDGTADAWWDSNFVISRMDENNRTDNPAYERHWSYGELLPWAVREGQGQIGWPGVP
jgi:hypothetical protein